MRKEPAGLVQKDGKRPDSCTLVPWRGGRPVAWDVTVCTTVAASYVTAVSQSAGAAVEQAAERKSVKYAELRICSLYEDDATIFFIPEIKQIVASSISPLGLAPEACPQHDGLDPSMLSLKFKPYV